VRLRSLIKEKKKEHNMKRLQFAVPFLMTLAFSRVDAQTMDLRATIPFEFRMGPRVLNAGTYTIHHSDGLLILSEENGGNATMGLTVATEPPTDSNAAVLVFHRYGDTYFLDKIWVPGYNTARGVITSSFEKELARRGPPDENPNIVLQTK
jgi:hypothetical protein